MSAGEYSGTIGWYKEKAGHRGKYRRFGEGEGMIVRNTCRDMRDKKVYMLDMDGTFYLGDRLLPGSLEFIEALGKKGKRYFFFTNNSSKNALSYAEKLRGMGCAAGTDQIITSGMVAARYFTREYPDAGVYLLGTPLLAEELRSAGVRLIEDAPDVVVVGFDTTLTYEKLSKVCTFVREGVPFIATHPDINCPTEDGFIPDCGAICAAITASTGVSPLVLGKPEAETVKYILERADCGVDDLIYIGDRLYTDIAMGVHGIATALVLSGEATLNDLKDSDVQPDIVADKLIDLAPLI